MHCINNISKPAAISSHHSKYNACCNKAPNAKCKESCKKSLSRNKAAEDIVNSLRKGGCKNLPPNDKLFQCLINSDHEGPRNRTKLGVDAAKKYCCRKAQSEFCKNKCFKVFTVDFSSWQIFEEKCLRTSEGDNLAQCLDEVEEPCELGCDGLGFCDNFNNRPTELFRSCNSETDLAARSDYGDWLRRGVIELPMVKDLYIRNSTNCHPITWKTIACTLQLKPCHRHTQTTRICRDDCKRVLESCFDWERIRGDANKITIHKICDILAPQNADEGCNTFQSFFEHRDPVEEASITKPCKNHPCRNNQYCQVNKFCSPDSDCDHHQCTPGCRLGESTKFMVPAGTYAKLVTNMMKNEECHMICQCSEQGHIENCATNYCKKQELCVSGGDRIEHGSTFYMGCNLCSCYDGEITCSKKQCAGHGVDIADVTTLPCNSTAEYSPVCGWNGVTYPNFHLANCFGLFENDYKNGTCESRDPCNPNPCPISDSCIPKRRVCLHSVYKTCSQYVCVKNKSKFVVDGHINCTVQPESTVCTTSGETLKNPCSMLYNAQELAYHGPCMNCVDEGKEVCGADGNTYSSSCSAMARLVHIDYYGPCINVGLIDNIPKEQCSNVVCPELKQKNCIGYTPPGACCPVCGGAVNLLYSQKQIDRIMEISLNGELNESFTVEAVLSALSRKIQVAECTLRGQLTIEMNILILVIPSINNPSDLQMEACVLEAEKIAVLVQRNSPQVSTELSLSILTAAIVVHQEVSNSAVILQFPILCLFLVITSLGI
ncbi:reversion-inducing cysteine-rich protein with Kazal motifs isoform X1 [Cimex lectularius]|uniref:Kazal-like domain-containing protein n=1 Tax=Cimex lectularius TaxID=79782 RepID=A0A8I6SJ46_CIMLE|nr:reversion-inducing cysteine-rich protein with Kazal motifs isoform X1 [Cimex lectularius]